MKKLIKSLSLFLLSFTLFGNVDSNRIIQVKGTSTKEISPNSAKISFEIETENENLDIATKQNAELLEKYKSLLKSLNVKYENIHSKNYNTDKQYTRESTIVNKGQKEYKTTLNVDISTLSLSSLPSIISTLSNEKIYSIKQNLDGSYFFTIEAKDKIQKTAYDKAIQKFNLLKNALEKNGINSQFIKISGFNNEIINLEKTEYKNVEKNSVTHTIEVTTRDLNNLGKFIDLSNALQFTTYGYIEYDIDNKEVLEDELYKTAYEAALKKAQVILNKTDLSLKKPITITDNSNDYVKIYIAYFDNYRYNYGAIKNVDEILKTDNSTILNKIKEQSTTIIPQKRNFSKTVYIEFEIN